MRRGIGLIRVSKVGDRGEDLISPELQRTAIDTYSVAKGIRIVDWVEALDESGSQRRSRWWQTLDATIDRVEAERLDCIVVWKFSRFARHRVKWAVALDRIESLGATLESATEGVDTTTSTGRFTRGMLAELEAFRAEQIGEGWREVKQRRVRLGLADGQPRFGYTLTGGEYRPNEWAPVLAGLYEQRIAGVSIYELTRQLREAGAVTRYGNTYTEQNLLRTLRTGFAAGLIYSAGEYHPGQHTPIISLETWQAFLATLNGPTGRTPQRHALSGLLLCVYCEKHLHATSRAGWPPGTLWMCAGLKNGTCRGTSAWAPAVMKLLDPWVESLLDGTDEEFQRLLQQAAAPRDGVRLRRRLVRVETGLLDIARKNQRGFYDDETYLRLRAELLDQKRELEKLLEEPPSLDVSVLKAYAGSAGTTRNALLRTVLLQVEVRTRERPKYRIVPLFRVE